MGPVKDQLPDEIHAQILLAAQERFAQYGYNKTTMAEIAKDCGMSAANLYRYFENKLDIGAQLACSCLDGEAAMLLGIVTDKQRPVAQRLEAMVLGMLHYTHKRWSETPKMNELVTAMCDAKMDIVDQHFFKKQALFVTLIKNGNQSGEFDASDPEVSADAILTACALLDIPLLMPLFTLEALERKARGLVHLILRGLQKR